MIILIGNTGCINTCIELEESIYAFSYLRLNSAGAVWQGHGYFRAIRHASTSVAVTGESRQAHPQAHSTTATQQGSMEPIHGISISRLAASA